MSSRAKIVFYPKNGSTGFCLDKLKIVEKYSGWSYNTDDFATDGYVYTDTKTSIADVNSNYWLKLKAVNGYKICDCHKTNSGDTSNMGDFEILEDNTVIVYPWNSGTATIVTNYLHIAVEEDTSNKHEVTHNLENCTCDCLAEYEHNTDVSITLSANEGCLFDTIPVLKMGDDTLSFMVSEDKTTATINFTIIADVVITGIANQYYTITANMTNCTCDKSVVKGGNQTITVIANDGYQLNSNIVLYDAGTSITSSYSDFTDENTKCVITHNVKGNLRITATAIKKTEKLSGFANLYQVTNNVLTDLSKVRFYKMSETSQVVDYGSFITNLYKLPFELPETMIADIGSIQLGNYDTKVDSDILANYVYLVPLGDITVQEKYHNVYDYKDILCRLHLPYCDSIDLQTEYVMNHTISILYKIDLYSGNCTVIVISNFTNEPVATKTFNIGAKIPFMQVQNNSVVNSIDNILDNNVFTPFIEVVRGIPYNVDTIFGQETVDFGTLENYKGYLKVSDVELNINAPNEEKSEIEMLLKNGVFINEKIVEIP